MKGGIKEIVTAQFIETAANLRPYKELYSYHSGVVRFGLLSAVRISLGANLVVVGHNCRTSSNLVSK